MASQGNPKRSIGTDERFNILDSDELCSRLYFWNNPRAAVDGLRIQPPQPQFEYEPRHLSPVLADALIECLGLMGYQPASDRLFQLLGTDHSRAAMQALAQLAPERLDVWLLTRAQDKQAPPLDREDALIHLCLYGATNHVRDLVLLLDDTTLIPSQRPGPRKEWRMCDRAADTIAGLLGWHERLHWFAPPQRREALVQRAKEWARTQRP